MNESVSSRSAFTKDSDQHFEAVRQRDLTELYAQRAQRLQKLAQDHELADYLLLAARVAQAQAQCAEPAPAQRTDQVLDVAQTVQAGQWLQHLTAIIKALGANLPAELNEALIQLQVLADAEKIELGQYLVQAQFDQVPSALAPILWAALSLELAMVARRGAAVKPEQEVKCCPVCGGLPVASLIHTGGRQGLRYLHCSLCESEWHMVRAKCSNCGDAKAVDYISLDTEEAAIRAESCNHCHGYLKVISLERDPEAETVADDLATLLLDLALAEEGYGRTGLNPFALPE